MSYWQINRRVLGRLRVAFIAMAVLAFLYILPSLLFLIPSIQRSAGNRVAHTLGKLLGTEVSIGRVSVDGWLDLSVDDILVLDSLSRPALKADRLLAGIELSDLILSQSLRVSSARLFGASIHLIVDSASGLLNVQPILERLSGSDEDSSSLVVDINTIILRDASISLQRKTGQILALERLNTKIRRLNFAPNQFGGVVDELNFSTSWGFVLRDMKAQIEGRESRITLSNLGLQLEESEISIPRLTLNTSREGLAIVEELDLRRMELSAGDIAPFYAPLEALGQAKLSVQAKLLGQGDHIDVEEWQMRLDNRMYLNSQGQIHLDSLGQWEGADLHTSPLQLSSSLVLLLPKFIPNFSLTEQLAALSSLGQVSYQGGFKIRLNELLAVDGLLSTGLGRWQTFALLERMDLGQEFVRLKLSTPRFDAAPLIGQTMQLGLLSGALELEANRPDSLSAWQAAGRVDIEQLAWRGYTYRDLQATITNPRTGRYQLDLHSADPNAQLTAEASFSLTGSTPRDLTLGVVSEGINLGHLGLEDGELSRYFTFDAEAHLSSLDMQEAVGALRLKHFSLVERTDSMTLRDLHLSLSKDEHQRYLSAVAPWLSLSLVGDYQLTELPSRMVHSFYRHIPLLHHIAPVKRNSDRAQWARLELKVDSLPRHLDRHLGLSLALTEPLSLSGRYDEAKDHLALTLLAKDMELSQHRLRDLQLSLVDNRIEASGDVKLLGGGALLGSKLSLASSGDSVELKLNLGREADGQENGVLHLSTLLEAASSRVASWEDLRAKLRLYPSKLRIHSALWHLAPAHADLSAQSVAIHGLRLQTEGRSLRVDGSLGKLPGDEIVAQLENINLRYILEASGIDFTMIETDLTGTARARLGGDVIRAEAQVTSPNFHLSGYDVAAIDVGLNWNSEDMNLNLHGWVNQFAGGRSRVDGHIRLETPAGIDLQFKAEQFDLGFVHVFTDGFLSTIGGRGTGSVRLFGPFERGVTVAGEAQVDGGEVGIKILGTKYFFDQKLRFTPERMIFDKLRLRDEAGRTGTLEGYIGHDHFGDFDIQLRAYDIDRLKLLQTTTNRDIPVYGTAYGSGQATLRGNEDRLSIDLALSSEAGTDLTLDFNPVQIGREESLMRFRPLRSDSLLYQTDTLALALEEQPMAFDMKMNLTVTPEAKMTLRLGYDGNNEIKGRGEGNLMINVPNLGESTVFGSLDITEGLYTFRLEQLAHKRFTIAEGGEIVFRGNPMQANLDLKAVYALTANIADLDEDLALDARRTNIPVHCMLGITGEITHPNVRFALELPGVDSELERRVRSLLNTDDAVMRQMLYLIALGKFYTPDQLAREGKNTTSNWTAVASSALSEQLSYLLGNLSETINIGTSIKTRNTAFEDTDIELLLSGSWFDNRLLFSANVGYHDNPYLNNTYIGEFDIEYKLNRPGTIRLKGYNHYNQMYQYLRQGLTTQGFGILFRQRFDRLGDLFSPAKSRIRPPRILPLDTLPSDAVPLQVQSSTVE